MTELILEPGLGTNQYAVQPKVKKEVKKKEGEGFIRKIVRYFKITMIHLLVIGVVAGALYGHVMKEQAKLEKQVLQERITHLETAKGELVEQVKQLNVNLK
jgi:hypothetical protein